MTAIQLSNGVHVASGLRELRTRLGITQKDLANDMGTNRQTVSRWEAGKESLSVEQMKSLCLNLKCTTEQLLGFNNEISDRRRDKLSVSLGANLRYGTLTVKTTVDSRSYPIDENARASILCQLKAFNLRSAHNKRRWIYCVSLDNKIVLVNPKFLQSIELVGDDVKAMPQYYCPEIYRALDDWSLDEVSETLRNECEIIIAKVGEEEAMRMVSFVRVTYDNGENEWNFLDAGSATTFFELEAAAFDVPQFVFAEIEEEGYYRARYANLDHVSVMEVPRDRYHKLTRTRPRIHHQRRTATLSTNI